MSGVNSFWFFGCSFTSGHGLCWDWLPSKEWRHDKKLYQQIGDEYADAIYPKLLANHFKLEYKNFSCSGNSNQTILVKLANYLHLMNEGDKVWVNTTWPVRLPVPHPRLDMMVETMVSKGIDDWGEMIPTGIWGDDLEQLIEVYMTSVLGKNPTAVYNHYANALADIVLHLNKRNIKSYIWSAPDRAHYYEKIHEWRSDVDDGHLSPNGHKQLYLDVIKEFET
tara:strand:+ start:3368 stop:4036 length:669 start_codon:yes stop_codon:yes gene_type:complete